MPEVQVGGVQSLPSQQSADLSRLRAGVCFPQDLEFVLDRKPSPRRPRHDFDPLLRRPSRTTAKLCALILRIPSRPALLTIVT